MLTLASLLREAILIFAVKLCQKSGFFSQRNNYPFSLQILFQPDLRYSILQLRASIFLQHVNNIH